MTTVVTGAHAARAMVAFLYLMVGNTSGSWARAKPSGAHLVATRAPLATFNGVFSALGEPRPEDVTEFASLADGFPWSVFARSQPSPELLEAAESVGLSASRSSPVMVRSAGPLHPAPPEVEVRRVMASDRAVYIDALAAGYETPRELFEVLMSEPIMFAPRVTCILVEVGGEPVATALGVVEEDLVGVYNVVTLPAHRGRGYGRAATTAALRAGYESGAIGTYLVSSEMGERLYRSMGYHTVERWTYLAAE